MWGHDTWEILECRGCSNVTFVHTHWFSEDSDDAGHPLIRRDLYPPSPSRAKPEWAHQLWRCLPREHLWLVGLHGDIYTALGTKAFSLAAMGLRAIADVVVTSQIGDIGPFKTKLDRMREGGLISELQVDILHAAFDAGSAAAHRGYNPSERDVYSLLDITEALLQRIYMDPMQEREHAKAAATLKERTPRRPQRE